MSSVSLIPRDFSRDGEKATQQHAADPRTTRGGEAELTRPTMSPELRAVFNRAFDAWERRQEQLTIWESA